MKTSFENKPTHRAYRRGILICMIALSIGGWLRFIPVLETNFPVNDGGMFYTMIDNLLKNNFVLPVFTSYNQLDIPFAYPPLGFYLAAALKYFFNIPVLTSLLWIPPIATTLCIAALYKLAEAMLGSPVKAGVAALCYALVPLSSTWLLMGGGVTPALGMLFLLLTIYNAYQLFHAQTSRIILKTIFWGSLTVLSHPEMTIQAIGISLFFLIVFFNRKNLLNAFQVALGVILLTSPWWFGVFQHHGIDPFLQAPKTGFYNLSGIAQLGLLKMVVEEKPTIVTLAGILGLVVALTKKEYRLALFLVIPYLIDPRNANTLAVLPMCMLAATGILELILPALQNFVIPKKGWITLASYLLLLVVTGSYGKMVELGHTTVTPDNQTAMQWIRENIPAQERFWLVTGNPALFLDPIMEWFPAISEHQNISTIQGREWIKGDQFFSYAESLQVSQMCYWQNVTCLEKAKTALPSFEYVYLPKQCTGESNCTENLAHQTSPLYLSLLQAKYHIVYENEGVIIFAAK